jgi:hypothetical protein
MVARTTVSSGTSTAAPVFTATAGGTTTNVRGVSVMLRIRSAPTVIQRFGSQTTVSTTAGTSAVVDLVASTPVGALQIVALGTNSTATPSTPSGWRRISNSDGQQLAGAYEQSLFARFKQTGDASTVTISINVSTDWAASAVAYTGVYYQDLSDTSTANSVPFQSFRSTADTGADALLNTGGSIINVYEDGWAISAWGSRLASPAWTSAGIRSTFPIQFEFTEVTDVQSSGTTKASIAWYDSNGGNVPISDAAMFAAGTAGATSAEKVAWWGTLRPAIGVAFDQQKTTVSASDSSTAVVDMPPGLDPGKLMVMSLVTGAATTPTTPDGWTLANTQTDGACSHHVYWKVSQGTGTSATVALGASTNWAALTRSFVGIDITNPFIDTQMDSETATDTTLTTTAITNTDDLGWAISAFGAVSASNGATWGITTSAGNIRENADISSSISGSTYVNLSGTHSNAPVPVGDVTFTGTGASSADKVAWSAVLRPAPTGAIYGASGQPAASATANDATVLTSDVSFIGEEHFGGTTINQTTATVNKPAGTAEGDLMLATIHTNDQTLTATGWTLVDNTLSGAMRSHLYYRIAGASEASSYDFSVGTATIIGAAISVWRNVDGTTPLDFEVSSATSGDPVTGPTLVTSVAAKIIHTRQARVASASNPTYAADKGTERLDFGTANTVSYSQALYEESGHTASGSITGASIDCSDTPTNTVSRTIALFPTGGSGTSANAGAVTVTGSADTASTAVTVNAETASATATTNNAVASLGSNAEAISAAATADSAAAALATNAGSAISSAVLDNPAGASSVTADSASATASAGAVTAAVGALSGSAVVTALPADASEAIVSTAGQAAATATADEGIGSLGAASEASTGSATANDATVTTAAQTNANAESATATVIAQDAAATVAVNADTVAAVAVPSDAASTVTASAGSGTASAQAGDAAAASAANTGQATATASADDGAAALTVNSGSPSSSAVAHDATASTVAQTDANAGTADASALANDGTASLAANSGASNGSVVANDATANTSAQTNANAESASATAGASDPTASVIVNAGTAVANGSASDAQGSISAGAVSATGTASALPGQGSLAASVESPTGAASVSDGASAVTANAGAPSGSVVANAATVNTTSDVSAQAGAADVTVTASDASNAVVANAGVAQATATAGDATASTAAEANAPAGQAQVLAGASDASSAVVVNAGIAMAGASVTDGSASLIIDAETCTVIGTADEGTATLAANAGTGAVSAATLDAELLRVAVLAMTAPVPDASLTEGLKGGPLAAMFPEVMVFMRSTPEGRIIVIPGRAERAVVVAEDRVANIDPEDRVIREDQDG